MPLPGISTLPPDFWPLRVGPLLNKLSGEGLSESYDKGNLGTRKTLSTAHSVVIENAARGFLGGCPVPQDSTDDNQCDRFKAEDLQKAWDKTIHQIIYETLIDYLFRAFARSGDVENLSTMVQAALKHIFLLCVSSQPHPSGSLVADWL